MKAVTADPIEAICKVMKLYVCIKGNKLISTTLKTNQSGRSHWQLFCVCFVVVIGAAVVEVVVVVVDVVREV